MEVTKVSFGGLGQNRSLLEEYGITHRVDWKEGARLGKDGHETAVGPGRQQLLLRPIWTPPGISPLLPISLLRCTFPELEPQETVSRGPAWVAWPLPTMAGKAWHLLGRFQSAGPCQDF